MEIENKLLNLLYAEWLKTHDPYDDDFENEIYQKTGKVIMKLNELEYVFSA